jgi:hypothetical protein
MALRIPLRFENPLHRSHRYVIVETRAEPQCHVQGRVQPVITRARRRRQERLIIGRLTSATLSLCPCHSPLHANLDPVQALSLRHSSQQKPKILDRRSAVKDKNSNAM